MRPITIQTIVTPTGGTPPGPGSGGTPVGGPVPAPE